MLARPAQITSSQLVYDGPVAVSGLILSGDGANADAQIYDGVNSQGKEVVHLEAKSGETTPVPFSKPMFLERGLYVAVNATTSKLTVLYQIISRVSPLGKMLEVNH